MSRHVSRWGVCVPSSCGPRELAALLAAPLAALAAPLGLRASLDVDPELWQRSAGHRLPSEAQQPQVFWWVARRECGGEDTPHESRESRSGQALLKLLVHRTLLIWLVTWVAFCSIADSAGKSGQFTATHTLSSYRRAITNLCLC